VKTKNLALPKQDLLMQTEPLPNTPHARMPLPPNLLEMFRLEEAMDFPVQEVHVVGPAKAGFSAAS
jgi:hypothetical protein